MPLSHMTLDTIQRNNRLTLLHIEIPLNSSNQFDESLVVDFETMWGPGVNIIHCQLPASLLETIEEGAETTKDLAKIMKDHPRCPFPKPASCGSAIGQHETHIHLDPFQLFLEFCQVFLLLLSGPL
jgi:hypothetical protein